MPAKNHSPRKDDTMTLNSQTLLQITGKLLLALLCFLAVEVRNDIKDLSKQFIQLRIDVDILQDRQLNARFKLIPPAKHEEIVSLDSLTSN